MGHGAPESVLVGGPLYQWDLERQVLVPPGTVEAHFALAGQSVAYGVEPDGENLVSVPNLLLQSGKSVDCWTTDEEHTVTHTRLPVKLRPKPPQYLYTPTEITNVRSLIADALAALSYEDLNDLPSIEEVTLRGDLYMVDFGVLRLEDADIEDAYNGASQETSDDEGD